MSSAPRGSGRQKANYSRAAIIHETLAERCDYFVVKQFVLRLELRGGMGNEVLGQRPSSSVIPFHKTLFQKVTAGIFAY